MAALHTRVEPEAFWFCRKAEPLDLFVVEDSIRSEHMAGHLLLRKHVNLPLTASEQWANKWEFREVIEEELADYVRIDICIAVGLTVPTTPGIRVSFNRDPAKAYPGEMTKPPHFRCEDGACTNH